MNSKITLHLTRFPVYDLGSPITPPPRYTGMLIDGKRIIEQIIGPEDMNVGDFTANAISWAEYQLKERHLKIAVVSGDAAVRSVVEGRGLKYQAEFNLS